MSDIDSNINHLHTMAQDLTSYGHSLRAAAMTSGGYDYADSLHNIYMDYGYPAHLTFDNYWNMYRRLGIAKSVVSLPVETGWSTSPEISGSAQFDRDLEKLNKRIDVFVRAKGLDLRQRVGRYAGMFMRVRDGLSPEKPIEGVLSGEAALMDMVPLYESQLEVIESDSDPSSETFGQPTLIQYSQSVEGDRNEETNNVINIHPSRIVFASEGADDGSIYGISALEPVYNSLMDLRKIIGGGAEGFYKNAAQKTIFNLKDGASAMVFQDKLNEFNDEYDSFRKSFGKGMWTPGMDAKTLESSLISPQDFFTVALNDVASGSNIPATILIGQQTGRLASSEDSRMFLSGVKSRQENFMSPMIGDVLDWLIKFGILPASEYEIEWEDLLARSDIERLESSEKMAAINEKQFNSGGDIAFSGDEIREASGYEIGAFEPPGDETIEDDV